ncbi:MAG: SpoIIE family protein phosphatase [Desulfobacterales bacterium]
MIIDNKIARKVTLLWIGCAFLAAHLLFLIFPNVFEAWNEQTTDRILSLKAKSKRFRSSYDGMVVHVDLNNTSLHALDNYYLDRSHHAQVIRNLAAMNVRIQMYDFIFAGPTDNEKDSKLIRATKQAGNVYFGMAFRLKSSKSSQNDLSGDETILKSLDNTKWQIENNRGSEQFYVGDIPLLTFSQLADVSPGTGYLNLKPDTDGVFRRLPLLVRYNDAFYPSFSLKIVCDFLNVKTRKVKIEPGIIMLKEAQYPGLKEKKDVAIPIDKHGNMRINFVGPWERMRHYNFSDVYLADDDGDKLKHWREELSGKIVLVSNVSTGSADVGQVPTDANYPLSGVHANAVYTILTGSFFKEPPAFLILLIEIVILLVMTIMSFHRSALFFTLGSLWTAGTYLAIVVLFIMVKNILFPIIRPLLLILFSTIILHMVSAIENARIHADIKRAKEVAERDLEIGRKIQSGFFPKSLPLLPGWEFVAYFKPARQVAGDFYDVFRLRNGKFIGIVIADVCDKGVGAALFMALIRSLVRAFVVQGFDDLSDPAKISSDPTAASLIRMIQQTNNYIAKTHEDDNMFATLFLGILNPKTGLLKYINCGHEPPVIVANGTMQSQLKPTGPAVGMMPDLDFRVKEKQFDSGDMLFAFTDGLTDAEDENGKMFTRERLLKVFVNANGTAEKRVEIIKTELFDHIAGATQFDDITMLAVRRD